MLRRKKDWIPLILFQDARLQQALNLKRSEDPFSSALKELEIQSQ